MTCEDKDLNQINKNELENDFRFHFWRSINVADEQESLLDGNQMEILQSAYINRFGGVAWVLFTNQMMRKDKEIFGNGN